MNVRMVAAAGFVLLSSVATAQAPSARGDGGRKRIAVLGQTDPAGTRLVARVIDRLKNAAAVDDVFVIPHRDVAAVIDETFRDSRAPIGVRDLREIARVLRADGLVAIVPDGASSAPAVIVHIAAPVAAPERMLGRWVLGSVGLMATAIVAAVRADTGYRRMR